MNESQKDDIAIRHIVASVTVRMEPPAAPPPPGFTSPFKTLEEWLFYLCDTEKPEKPIADLQFCLSESPASYMVSVNGFNKYDIEKDVIAYRIDFKPVHGFFPLPKEKYENLSKLQVREQVLSELAELTRTAKFQESFLAQANSIKLNFTNGTCSRLK